MAKVTASQSNYTIVNLFTTKVDLLIARKDEISIRFDVQMDLEKPEGSGVSGCWVNIAGSPKKVETAKSYICNLCDPPDTGTTAYPGDLHGYLSDKSVVFDLENKYSVIVEFIDADEVDQPGKATVKGNELNVALALSAIEDMIAQYIEKNQITLQESSSCSHLSTQHSYSDQTSSKLNESLMGVSNQIQLDKKAAASYPDVMKKLMLSWVAASADGNEETVDVDIADDTMTGSDGDADKTVVHSAPKSPITSTPIVPSNTSRVKVERLSYVPIPRDVKSLEDSPGLRLSNRQAAAGRPAADATDSPGYLASRPGPSGIQRQTKGSPPLVDLCETEHFSSDDETTIMVIPPKKMAASTNHAAASRTKPAHNPAARESRCEGSPTTQTERDISTISLDDDVSAASEYQVIDETGYDGDMIRLAEIGATRGYTQVEIAQALSLCESEDLSEQKFFSHLTQVRRESQTPPSPRTPQGQRPKKGRNAALESINKRQQSMSPGVREVMPIEKRVRTAAPPPSARMPVNNLAPMAVGPSLTAVPHQPISAPPLPSTQFYQPPPPMAPALPASNHRKTRMVVLDGSNIAYHHGAKYYGAREKVFSSYGILLAVKYLQKTYGATNENTKVIVPNYRRTDRATRDSHLLDQLQASGYLVFSPCKTMPGGRRIMPYDDRFILDLAVATDGVVISNDKYEDLRTEQNCKYRDVIDNRVIMFMFAEDIFMIPTDPMGRTGPTLENLLRPSRWHSQGMNNRPAPVARPRPVFYRVPQASTMRPAAQQVPPSHRNVPFSSNQIPRPSSSMPPAPRERTASETQHIMGQLLSIFPERREDIIRLISRHPHEKSVDAFVDSLL